MSYFGKDFTMERQENFEEFINSFKIKDYSPELKRAESVLTFVTANDYKPTTKIVKNGDKYTIHTSTMEGKSNEATFTSGVPYDDSMYGKKAKVTVTVDGDTFNEVKIFEDGSIVQLKREYKGNELLVTITTNKWDGVCKRYYKMK